MTEHKNGLPKMVHTMRWFGPNPGARDASNGYRGRTGIYELVVIDEHMRAMIHDGASELELERYARMRTPGIRDDGRAKVLSGVTTIEEVLKVTRED